MNDGIPDSKPELHEVVRQIMAGVARSLELSYEAVLAHVEARSDLPDPVQWEIDDF